MYLTLQTVRHAFSRAQVAVKKHNSLRQRSALMKCENETTCFVSVSEKHAPLSFMAAQLVIAHE